MTVDQITYLVFGIVLVLALVFDLGLLSKKNQQVSIKQALNQTFFWVGLALAFFFFVWYEKGQGIALEYLSAYLMEWSLSIDNIFVFILIFSAFSVAPRNYGRVLLTVGLPVFSGVGASKRFWKKKRTSTPTEMEASAMLKMGLKNSKPSPPTKGTHSGQVVFMIGK